MDSPSTDHTAVERGERSERASDRSSPSASSTPAQGLEIIDLTDNEQWDVPPGWHVTWPDPPSPRDERVQQFLGLLAVGCAFAIASSLALWLWRSGDSPGLEPARGGTTFANADVDTESDAPAAVLAPGELGPVAPADVTPASGDGEAGLDDPKTGAALDGRASRGRYVDTGRPRSRNRTTGLLVVSDPPGARVTVNGVGYGATPARIPFPPSGAKRIRVTLDGFETEERYFGPETSMSSATLRVVMHQRVANPYRATTISDVGAPGQQHR